MVADRRLRRCWRSAVATGGVPPELNVWIAAVDAASNGNIKFDLRPPSSDESWRAGEIDFETGTLSDVAAGTVDMAWIGARAFDLTGVTAFQPLLAPMLVDSHDVQDAVFAAGIPQRMLAAVDSADIVGLGVLPGPMKMVLGVQHPFLEPSDFVGATFGTVDSALTNATLQALGATPRPLPTTAGLDGLDGYEQHAASIVGNHFPETAKYVTANLDLWPRPLVIVINRRRFEQLDHDQQHTLRAAASTAMADAAAAARADDANAASRCAVTASSYRWRPATNSPHCAPPCSPCTTRCAPSRRPAPTSPRSNGSKPRCRLPRIR